jgi:hypothetical protein
MRQRLEFVVYDEDESQERFRTSDQLFGRSHVIVNQKAVPGRIEHGRIQLQRHVNVVLLATIAERLRIAMSAAEQNVVEESVPKGLDLSFSAVEVGGLPRTPATFAPAWDPPQAELWFDDAS